MASLWLTVTTVLLLCAAASTKDVSRCYDCFTTAQRSSCHVQPKLELAGIAGCRRGTSRCVTERHQAKDGSIISLRRRCATWLESRFSYNRCDDQTDGSSRCLSYCRGELCNSGTGRLYTATRYWNYDSPDYADYVFDPEEAVLDPDYGGDPLHERHWLCAWTRGQWVLNAVLFQGLAQCELQL
ncbi:uncharacterized protein LOC119095044 [Pollicipes pollicipes]|uniref:uncharacterized protein LOC119095044 n=1 Tax=Pollicipes pollicipes TaxID=41117 RepID=UPI00188549B5|nr:uncharacterized protein LOC119095044 [Pollicipes pollicipes]